MNSQRLTLRLAATLAALLLVTIATPLWAATLTWVGDVDTGWGTDVAGDTNWSGDLLPMPGDDLVFLASGTYSGNLDLGGSTFDINSITVGDSGDLGVGGDSDFGVSNRVLSQNGTIDLGGGGMTVNMTTAAGTRNISFDSDIDLTTASTSITRATNTSGRQLFFNGVISGTSDLTLEAGCCSPSLGINLGANNTFVGDVTQRGTVVFRNAGAFGDNANEITLAGGTVGGSSSYHINQTAGAVTTEYDLSLNTGGTSFTYRNSASAWTINGDVTGGASNRNFDLFNSNGGSFIFNGAVQDFTNRVLARTGARITISSANGGGVAWENAAFIRMNWTTLGSQTSHLLLQGDFTLNQLIEVIDNNSGNQDIPVHIGQVNNGGPFDATFNGRIDVQDPDAQILRLTADADGSATFNGEININGGGFGFDKIGDGTVILNGRVSEDLGNSTAIGAVSVQAGTLQVNSTEASGGLITTGVTVDVGAELGGTGFIDGSVLANGDIGPGASVGTLSVRSDVEINGSLIAELNATTSDLLAVGNQLTLGGSSILELQGIPTPGQSYTLATFDSLIGTFDTVLLNGVPQPGSIGEFHMLLYLDNSIVLSRTIPEPSSLMLLGLGCCGLCGIGRRKGRRACITQI